MPRRKLASKIGKGAKEEKMAKRAKMSLLELRKAEQKKQRGAVVKRAMTAKAQEQAREATRKALKEAEQVKESLVKEHKRKMNMIKDLRSQNASLTPLQFKRLLKKDYDIDIEEEEDPLEKEELNAIIEKDRARAAIISKQREIELKELQAQREAQETAQRERVLKGVKQSRENAKTQERMLKLQEALRKPKVIEAEEMQFAPEVSKIMKLEASARTVQQLRNRKAAIRRKIDGYNEKLDAYNSEFDRISKRKITKQQFPKEKKEKQLKEISAKIESKKKEKEDAIKELEAIDKEMKGNKKEDKKEDKKEEEEKEKKEEKKEEEEKKKLSPDERIALLTPTEQNLYMEMARQGKFKSEDDANAFIDMMTTRGKLELEGMLEELMKKEPEVKIEKDENENLDEVEGDAENPPPEVDELNKDTKGEGLHPLIGLGLVKKYGIHPNHIKEGKNKYTFTKKGQRHVKALKKLLNPHHAAYVVNWSILNKKRNDIQGLKAKAKKGRKTRGGFIDPIDNLYNKAKGVENRVITGAKGLANKLGDMINTGLNRMESGLGHALFD
jgi:hypothetical protein